MGFRAIVSVLKFYHLLSVELTTTQRTVLKSHNVWKVENRWTKQLRETGLQAAYLVSGRCGLLFSRSRGWDTVMSEGMGLEGDGL